MESAESKILIIVGPTATGKTRLGLRLAQKYGGEIVSADSKQIYRGMDIGTGKGLDTNSSFHLVDQIDSYTIGYYLQSGVKIWGYDLVGPDQSFSVAEYRQLMWPVIEDIWLRGRLPIVVGGTGYYIQALVYPPQTLGINIDPLLRQELEALSVEELQQRLERLAPARLASMNQSDRANPRRLVRAIEVNTALEASSTLSQTSLKELKSLWLGLTAPKASLLRRVELSVNSRATQSFSQEIDNLNQSGFNWQGQAATATGYSEWRAYMQGQMNREQAVESWIKREHAYQKRQLTWFKKNPAINWFPIEDVNWFDLVDRRIQAW